MKDNDSLTVNWADVLNQTTLERSMASQAMRVLQNEVTIKILDGMGVTPEDLLNEALTWKMIAESAQGQAARLRRAIQSIIDDREYFESKPSKIDSLFELLQKTLAEDADE